MSPDGLNQRISFPRSCLFFLSTPNDSLSRSCLAYGSHRLPWLNYVGRCCVGERGEHIFTVCPHSSQRCFWTSEGKVVTRGVGVHFQMGWQDEKGDTTKRKVKLRITLILTCKDEKLVSPFHARFFYYSNVTPLFAFHWDTGKGYAKMILCPRTSFTTWVRWSKIWIFYDWPWFKWSHMAELCSSGTDVRD